MQINMKLVMIVNQILTSLPARSPRGRERKPTLNVPGIEIDLTNNHLHLDKVFAAFDKDVKHAIVVSQVVSYETPAPHVKVSLADVV